LLLLSPLFAAAAKRRKGTPYVDMRSEEGIFGMTLLQKALLEEEEQQAAGEDVLNSLICMYGECLTLRSSSICGQAGLTWLIAASLHC
jgi:hypothetical protein